jgi:lantibiotic modifying enzyme
MTGRALEAASGAFGWVGAAAVGAEGGLGWCEGGAQTDDLYCGTAGVLLGCAEATAAGLDTTRVASGARGRLLHLARDPGVAKLPDDGLFSGWAGVAVALHAWAGAAADDAAAEGAALVAAQVAGRAAAEPGGAEHYTDIISGDAGILLALLTSGSDDALPAAHVLAGRLARLAEPAPGGLHWRMTADWPYLMPGFSHGTAGCAYALAVAGRALHRRDLVDIAIRGAEALLAVGDRASGWAVPLMIPSRPDRPEVFYGWCHGPAGTARLFAALQEIDPQPRWQAAIDGCVQALRDSRLPARLYPGYWDNLGRCCGTAGVGEFLLDRYQATADTALLDWADTLAADVLARTVTTPDGVTWSNTEHTKTPPQLPPEPGLMQGTAGIAAWLARLHALHTGTGAGPAPSGRAASWL